MFREGGTPQTLILGRAEAKKQVLFKWRPLLILHLKSFVLLPFSRVKGATARVLRSIKKWTPSY